MLAFPGSRVTVRRLITWAPNSYQHRGCQEGKGLAGTCRCPSRGFTGSLAFAMQILSSYKEGKVTGVIIVKKTFIFLMLKC